MTTIRMKVNSEKSLFEFVRQLCALWLKCKYLNVTATDRRSLSQNAKKSVLYKEAADLKGDMTANQVELECKLNYGMSILRRHEPTTDAAKSNSVKFWAYFDSLIYEERIELMRTTDVTKIMSTAELSEYIDELNEYINKIRTDYPQLS